VVDEVDGSQKVLGACRGIEEETDKDLVDCGAHMSHSCMACVERYSYHCEEKYRYCNGDCNYENGDCGPMCPEEEITTPEAVAEEATIPEAVAEEVGGDGTGDNLASTGFDSGAMDLLR